MEYITNEELEELNDVYNTIVEFDDIPEISKSIAKLLFMNARAYAHTREVSKWSIKHKNSINSLSLQTVITHQHNGVHHVDISKKVMTKSR